MRGRLGRQVNPRVTAIVILLALAGVQWVWWRGLVMRPKVPPGQSKMGGAMLQGATLAPGRRDVVVDTLAGMPEAGDADGPGRDARFDGPTGIAVDAAGNLYVADTRNSRVRRVAPDGQTTTLAGSAAGYQDGPAASARFNSPCGVAVAPDGTVYVADTGNSRIRRVKDGQVTTVDVKAGAGAAAVLKSPTSLAYVASPRPTLLVADTMNRRVLALAPDGAIVTSYPAAGTPNCASAGPPLVYTVPQPGDIQVVGGAVLRAVDIQPFDAGVPPGTFRVRQPVAVCKAPEGWYAVDQEHAAVLYVRDGMARVLAGVCNSQGRAGGWTDGPGDNCTFGLMGGIAADSRHHVYVADTGCNAIRRLTLPEDLSQAPRRTDQHSFGAGGIGHDRGFWPQFGQGGGQPGGRPGGGPPGGRWQDGRQRGQFGPGGGPPGDGRRFGGQGGAPGRPGGPGGPGFGGPGRMQGGGPGFPFSPGGPPNMGPRPGGGPPPGGAPGGGPGVGR